MNENSEITLPPLSEARIQSMERAVFDAVRQEPRGHSVPHVSPRRRRRRWVTGLSVAAAFVGGILIAPPLLNAVGPVGAGDAASVHSEIAPARDAGGADSGDMADSAGGMSAADGDAVPSDASAAVGGEAAMSPDATANRDIITTAEVVLRVDDVGRTADSLGDLASGHGGYVESTDIGLAQGDLGETSPAAPRQPGSGWVRIRIPAAQLDEVMRAVSADGTVLRSSISRQDVTSVAVDLRARVEANKASVQRLTELMSKSGSVGDLITAESALSERQAQLESYEQELKALDEQVALSTVTIQLSERTTATAADPARFGDGLLAGWNGLVVTLNALVVALGFLLPWLVIAGAVLLVIWLIRRRRRA